MSALLLLALLGAGAITGATLLEPELTLTVRERFGAIRAVDATGLAPPGDGVLRQCGRYAPNRLDPRYEVTPAIGEPDADGRLGGTLTIANRDRRGVPSVRGAGFLVLLRGTDRIVGFGSITNLSGDPLVPPLAPRDSRQLAVEVALEACGFGQDILGIGGSGPAVPLPGGSYDLIAIASNVMVNSPATYGFLVSGPVPIEHAGVAAIPSGARSAARCGPRDVSVTARLELDDYPRPNAHPAPDRRLPRTFVAVPVHLSGRPCTASFELEVMVVGHVNGRRILVDRDVVEVDVALPSDHLVPAARWEVIDGCVEDRYLQVEMRWAPHQVVEDVIDVGNDCERYERPPSIRRLR